MPTEAKSFSTPMVALAPFGLAGSAGMVTIPGFFAGPARPDLTIFPVAGVAVVPLTAGLFGFIDRPGMGFGKTVLVLAAGHNAMIAAVKLGPSPAAPYRAVWVVFPLTLVSIWPFRAYTPKKP